MYIWSAYQELLLLSQEFQLPEDFVQNESYANLTIVVLDANDNAPTWYNYDRLRRKHSSMESEGVSMDDEKENINSVIPTYTVKGSVISRVDNSVNVFILYTKFIYL